MKKSQTHCEVKIGKEGTTMELHGLAPGDVTYLAVYAGKKSNLQLLSDFPNLKKLFLNGDFTDLDAIAGLKNLTHLTMYLSLPVDFSNLKGIELESLSASCKINETFSAFFSDRLKALELNSIRQLKDLSFIEQIPGLKKLYLNSLPGVEELPDLSKLKNLYALKLYELHKLNNIENLIHSSIQYLDFTLAADKLSGTKIAEVLLSMEQLKGAYMDLIDRSSPKRFEVIENKLKKVGRADLLDYQMLYSDWEAL